VGRIAPPTGAIRPSAASLPAAAPKFPGLVGFRLSTVKTAISDHQRGRTTPADQSRGMDFAVLFAREASGFGRANPEPMETR
jgi:hypothetical protein